MAGIVENVATHVAESLADKAMQELKYLCCYKSYVEDLEDQKKHLKARRETMQKDIEEAHNRNENQIESEVKLWREEADGLIEEDTKGKKKWFGLVPNCCWQYNRGKDLEDKKQRIQKLVEQSNNFTRVARSTGLPGIEFYSIENFMQLKDRKLQFGQLTEALKHDKKFVIGLFGLGGTGKTTMANEVGKEVAESRVFDKVIFSVVSTNPNLKKIRDNIAKHLNLPLNEKMNESEQAQELWKRITEGGEKVLIILDDVWKKLSLKDLGIPLGRHGKSCCSILLTTRDQGVCNDMGCHEPIKLEVLSEKDAVDLFLSYAAKSIDSSSNGFKDVALGIVKECGRLPVAIVAVARALKSKPLNEWNDGLKRLQNPKSIHDVKEDLKEAYNSLRLSYDYLENEEARKLFLLCSLFPDDYEIPIELLTRIAIGMGLCGGADKYSVARSYFTPIKNVLMDSCLVLKAENEAIKMHDLVREVALWIGNQLVQVVKDSSTMLMENIQYSSWNINDFPSHFDGRKLEVLLLWISNAVKVPDGIFEGMEKLKILALMSGSNVGISGASLFQSHPSLINVRSLAIKGFELGDLSFLVNLKSLESLELRECSMLELPKEIGELKKLRLLEMVRCLIERNNPFEVIGSCLQLEELYFVSNRMDEDTCESLAQITSFPELERYMIKAWSSSSYKEDFSISGYFDSKDLRVNFSDEIFKSLVARVEVLKLNGDYINRGWTNVVPDILPMKDDSMEDHLTWLCLESMNGIKCLIRTQCLQSTMVIFSKLVKLKLSEMDVRELCCGPYPINFLKQLEELDLSGCKNLEGLLFDGKLELCNLKSILLHECSMTCLFLPFTAQSLKQLEFLRIEECSELKYIVAKPMEDHDPNQKSDDSMFPKLKHLKIKFCPELEFILPICFCKDFPLLITMKIFGCEKLEYIFGQYPDETDLHQMGKEAILQSLEELQISRVPNFINLYAECYLPCPCSDKVHKSSPSTNVEDCTSSLLGGLLCCFWPKSNASTIYHPSASMNHNEGMKVNYVVNRACGLFTPLLYPYIRLRRLEISKLVGLKSLFTLSIVSSLKLLKILRVEACNTLEHIVTVKEDDHDHMNVNSIFPNLQEVIVRSCSNLEYLFPAFYSRDFKDLKSVWIKKADKLTNVFGKCQADQNHNVHIDLNLPALKRLYLSGIPNIVSICAQNYSMMELYLEDITLDGCPQLPLETSIDLLVAGHKRQEDLSRIKALPPLEEKGKPLYNLQELPEFKEPKSYMRFQNLSKLTIKGCKHLKFIFSASTSRRLQKLRMLEVKDCEELVSIIEDQENNKNPMAPQFPELRTIEVRDCKSMEYLFSISSGKLPGLLYVDIQDTPQLGEVFRWKHGEGQKLVLEDVFPELCMIRLVNLSSLHTICQGIEFHTVKFRSVRECPAISLTSAYGSFVKRYKLLSLFFITSADYTLLAANLFMQLVDEDQDVDYKDEVASHVSMISQKWDMDAKMDLKAIGEHFKKDKQNRISPNLLKIEVKGSQEDIINDSIMPQRNNGLPNLENSEEVSKEIAEEDTTTKSNLPNFTKSTKTSANEIVEEKLSTTPSSDLDMSEEASKEADEKDSTIQKQESSSPNLMEGMEVSKEIAKNGSTTHKQNSNLSNLTESINASANEIVEEKLSTTLSSNSNVNTETSKNEIVEEQLPTSNAAATPSSKSNRELCGKESMDDQQVLGESRSSNETRQRVEEPNNIECSSKDRSKERTLTIPPSITETTSPPISLICSPKKPENETSAAHVEIESASSAIIDQNAQGQIMVNQRETSIEDDLTRLFWIMRDDSDMEIDLSYVSNIAAFEDDKVAKAFADIESSLKMDLHQIAISKDHTHRLENALNFLSTHFSEEEPSSHGLVRRKIQSLHQEIQRIISSFKQSSDTLDTFTKLKEKEKWIDEQHSQRLKAATTLVSEIRNSEDYMNEMKEQICRLQEELKSKEKEFEEYEIKLSSLQKQKKECFCETIEFMEEYVAVKKDKSYVGDGQTKARQELKKLETQWPSCVANLRKTSLLLGILLKHKP